MLSSEVTKTNQKGYPYEEALDMISDGLEALSLQEKTLGKLCGRRLIDFGARINAQSLALEKLLIPVKDRIKSDAISNHKEEIPGNVYKAVVKSFDKVYWKFEDLKRFLGSQMPKFQEVKSNVQVSFEVKE